MSRVFHDVKVGLDEELEEKLAWMAPNHQAYHILRESVDARKRHSPHKVYSVRVFDPNEKIPSRHIPVERFDLEKHRPIIVGAGPAGLFCALRLIERGLKPILMEQGSRSEKRILSINKFWRYGELDPKNNVGFGEGGAGMYSDGKLITRIKSPYIPYVIDRLVDFGAPEEIRYFANPHVGSDKIRRLLPRIRQKLLDGGCEILFDTEVSELITNGTTVTGVKTTAGDSYLSDHVILATGHSAENIFTMLRDTGVYMEGKSFAMGLRIEHPQELINKIQYRDHFEHPKLSSANYKLAYHNRKDNFGVYSFCMCPGGYVLSSGTEKGRTLVNGMSNYKRNSPFANAAVVVSIDHQKSFGKDLWGGMKLRQQLEEESYKMIRNKGESAIPVQSVPDFMNGKTGKALPSSSPSEVVASSLHELLPDDIYKNLLEGLENFRRKMPTIVGEQGQLHGIESRTSCPVRVTRNSQTLESLSHPGLFPCGEGAGYAGGITSAACDGIRIAEKITENVTGKILSHELENTSQ